MLAMTGCSGNRATALSPLALRMPPKVQTQEDPSMLNAAYRTFTVVPASQLTKASIGGILERQMLFGLRNGLERRGYLYVEPDKSPDFVATLDGTCEYKEVYVPPQTVSVPLWVPGQTVTTYGMMAGSFNASGGWGTYSGTYSQTTQTPGHLTSLTYTQPGYTSGAYYPALKVVVLDTKTEAVVWCGSGVGVSVASSDIRVCGQMVLAAMLEKFPDGGRAPTGAERAGRFGMDVAVVTVEGNHFTPVVLHVEPKSPAAKAGVEVGDVILGIGEFETPNKSFNEVVKALDNNAGGSAKLVLWRVNQQVDVELIGSRT